MSHLLEGIHLVDPIVPLVANITGQAMTTADEIRRELSEQLCKPVAWVTSVRSMVESGVGTFVEVGPGQVLSGLIKKISDEVDVLRVEDLIKGEGGNGEALAGAPSS